MLCFFFSKPELPACGERHDKSSESKGMNLNLLFHHCASTQLPPPSTKQCNIQGFPWGLQDSIWKIGGVYIRQTQDRHAVN